MKNQLKLMVSNKVADRSHFGSNIESLFYHVSPVMCHMSHVMYHMHIYIYIFFVLTKW